MQHFWSAGYGATSVRTLGMAMGLGSASLYNAFGDKHALFQRCLDRYLDGSIRSLIKTVETSLPPVRAIEAFITERMTKTGTILPAMPAGRSRRWLCVRRSRPL